MVPLLTILFALICGLGMLFVFLGIGKAFSKDNEKAEIDNLIEQLNRDELESEKREAGLPSQRSWSGYWLNLALQSGQKPNNHATPGNMVAGVIGFSVLGGYLVWPGDLFGGILIAVGLTILIRTVYISKIKARHVLMDKQLPNLLSGIRSNLQANLTPQQAIVNQAKEIPAPLGDELKILVQEMEVNVTLDQALRNFGLRVPSREIQFLVAAFRTAIASGADLDPLIATIQGIVVQRQRIANALASAVATVQPALWVTGIMIPAAFIWSFYSNPEQQAFWLSIPGLIIIAICGFFYGLGLFIAKKQIDKVRNS